MCKDIATLYWGKNSFYNEKGLNFYRTDNIARSYNSKAKVNWADCPVGWAVNMGNKTNKKMNHYGEMLYLWKK